MSCKLGVPTGGLAANFLLVLATGPLVLAALRVRMPQDRVGFPAPTVAFGRDAEPATAVFSPRALLQRLLRALWGQRG